MFLSQLEAFSKQYQLGLNALKNLIKSVLLISFTMLYDESEEEEEGEGEGEGGGRYVFNSTSK